MMEFDITSFLTGMAGSGISGFGLWQVLKVRVDRNTLDVREAHDRIDKLTKDVNDLNVAVAKVAP